MRFISKSNDEESFEKNNRSISQLELFIYNENILKERVKNIKSYL